MKILKKIITFLLTTFMIFSYPVLNVFAEENYEQFITTTSILEDSHNHNHNESIDENLADVLKENYRNTNPEIDTYCTHPVLEYACFGKVKYKVTGLGSMSYYNYNAIVCSSCSKFIRYSDEYHHCFDDFIFYYYKHCPYGHDPGTPM